jgi:oligopeptide/dipeptide ABC transporter ATP-binding protein
MLISHDLSVVRYLSDHIIVLYLGKIMEMGPSEEFFENASHPYSKALIAAIPIPDPNIKRHRIKLRGETPSPIHIPKGCRFHSRCPFFDPKIGCDTVEPKLNRVGNLLVHCHLYD